MYPNAYSIFQDAVKGEAFHSFEKLLVGRTILAVSADEDNLTLYLDDDTAVEYTPWHAYAEDSGITLRVNGQELEQRADYVGPPKPSMTPDQVAEYEATLGPFQLYMYREMRRVYADMSRGLRALSFAEGVDELPEPSE